MGLAGTAGGSFVDDLVAPGSQSERAMELLRERFPEAADGSAMAVFAVDHGGTLDSRREVIEAALARVAKVEHVVAVADPFEAGTVSPDGRIGFAELTFDLPASDLGPTPFEALADAGVNIEMISTSTIRISCVIRASDAGVAVRAIHDRFRLSEEAEFRHEHPDGTAELPVVT
jgi:hypothetical protein